MIIIAFPVGSAHGWGICGKYISRELAGLTHPAEKVRLVTQQFTPESIGDELEFQSLAALMLRADEARHFQNVAGITRTDGPVLTSIADKQMTPWAPNIRGTRTVGYTFFEENLLQPAWLENARRHFDRIATGSSWCTQVLQSYGLTDAHTVIQGVDPRLFFPWPASSETPEREYLRDRFVIFSGGKFEFRKGQDLVIRAVKVLQDRHPDVFLINSWFNAWQQSIDTMRNSPYLRFPTLSGPYIDTMNRLLAENGLDVSRVLTLGPRANALMPRIYRNTDVGLFPNRCEGGTNLVLMEYMACGNPVVATATTGHSDVVRSENAAIISATTQNTIKDHTGPVAQWPEPSLDDTIEKLEWVYQHRAAAAELGRQAGADLSQMTWTAAARGFQEILH